MSKIPSLIHTLFDNNGFEYKPTEIENTGNGIWLKDDFSNYPWSKKNGQLKFINLLGYITNNSVSKDKKKVNYLLWSDIAGSWHFKTVDKILKDAPTPHKFFINPDAELIGNKIYSVVVINDNDNISNLENNIFFCSYDRVDPDYSNSYLDFTDTNVGLTYSNVFYNYNTDFNTTKHVAGDAATFKLFDDKKLKIGITANNNIITVTDTNYGYFSNNFYNTSTPVWWDYLGKQHDKYNNISWQSQFDLTSLNFDTFYEIHTKIRVPLMSTRLKFNELKNIKRKWEAYRCVVCCLDQPIGCTKDLVDFKNAVNNPFGSTFSALFGANGLFVNKPYEKDYIDLGGSSGRYQITAAGSFTDQLNYVKGSPFQNGLTYSRNLTGITSAYNTSIGKFYNIAGVAHPSIERYQTETIDRSILEYDTTIQDNIRRLTAIKTFLNSVDSWINDGISFINSNIVPCEECTNYSTRRSILETVNNYWSIQQQLNNDNLDEYFTTVEAGYSYGIGTSCGPSTPNIPISFSGGTGPFSYTSVPGIGKIPHIELGKTGSCLKTIDMKSLPPWCKECSEDIFVRGKDNPLDLSQYSSAGGSYYDQQSSWGVSEKCTGNFCYNENCFHPNILIALKEHAYRQFNALRVENYLLNKMKTIISAGIKSKWTAQYKEWIERPAFFYSKKPGKSIFKGPVVEGYRGTTLYQPLSLQGVKSITRKDIRGSRYEILAKSKGITNDSIGPWLYNIFFEDETAVTYTGKTANPYYAQSYPPSTYANYFATDRNLYKKKILQSRFEYYSNSNANPSVANGITMYHEIYGVSGDGVFTSSDIIPMSSGMSLSSISAFDVFNITPTSKPANLKREEIASYMRVEFTTPIGLDRISDFPQGFVRDAGVEYFLPYLVSLTPGPTGRQTIRNNIAIIGMDPYGFDVAVKKSKIENKHDSRNYWWWEGGNTEISQTEVTRNGMDLWPEYMFETKYPYYAEDSRGIYSYSDWYVGYETPSEKWNKNGQHWQRSAEIDPERRKTAMGSGLLMGSHRKIKPHRSWWSFYMPHNIFVPQKLYSALKQAYANDISNVFTHGHINIGGLNGDIFDGWLTFSPDDDIPSLLTNTNFTNVT